MAIGTDLKGKSESHLILDVKLPSCGPRGRVISEEGKDDTRGAEEGGEWRDEEREEEEEEEEEEREEEEEEGGGGGEVADGVEDRAPLNPTQAKKYSSNSISRNTGTYQTTTTS
ncbi:uncharacterized protein [Macrobrachium rosenbergii]|uniref:uncharacterized protein n=1 Tax=Macrobrachium rosenbergii TaxID=79674 RepID=UPI0034D60EB0